MSQVCWYFQLHQPYRLRELNVLDVGGSADPALSYFATEDQDDNRAIFQKVAQKSYLPMLQVLLDSLEQVPSFKFALSCSGVFLEQAQKYEPKVWKLLQKLAESDRVEWLAETYYHSLASLYSPEEFKHQVERHRQLLKKSFGVQPKVFRNTELVYSNQVAAQVSQLGFVGMLTEGVDRYLHGRPRTQVYTDVQGQLKLLLKHAQLSDDIAFRFSDRNWVSFPLHADTYLDWLEVYGESEILNLFMDFETFGEHQWESTGIFEFFADLLRRFSTKPWNTFVTPSQVFEAQTDEELPMYDVPLPISWADIDRDLTAWTDNAFQRDCLRIIYDLEAEILKCEDQILQDDWRKLQTSDHFYYMCTKWSADGDVHAYFSPYDSPYEAYRRFSIVLADLKHRLSLTQQGILADKTPQTLLH